MGQRERDHPSFSMRPKIRIPWSSYGFCEEGKRRREADAKVGKGPYVQLGDGTFTSDFVGIRDGDSYTEPVSFLNEDFKTIDTRLEHVEDPVVLAVPFETVRDVDGRITDWRVWMIEEPTHFTAEVGREHPNKLLGFPKGHRKMLNADPNTNNPVYENPLETLTRELQAELGGKTRSIKEGGLFGYFGPFFMGQSHAGTKVHMYAVEMVSGTVEQGRRTHDDLDPDEDITVVGPLSLRELRRLYNQIPPDMTLHTAIPQFFRFVNKVMVREKKLQQGMRLVREGGRTVWSK